MLTEAARSQGRTQKPREGNAVPKATQLVSGGHGTGAPFPARRAPPHTTSYDLPDGPRLLGNGLLSARGTRAKAASSEMKLCSAS